MSQYHKIKTVFLRDPDNNYRTLLEGTWAKPEFGYLADLEWEWTEKIDGMNMRAILSWTGLDAKLHFAGKSDRAQIPGPLQGHMESTFTRDDLAELFEGKDVVLYGEGFGGKIQKGGGRYGIEQKFILFDVCVAGTWLERDNVKDIASRLGIPVVPIVGRGRLADMVEFVRAGHLSECGAGESFDAEGVVARPKVELANRFEERVITKLKLKDFAK